MYQVIENIFINISKPKLAEKYVVMVFLFCVFPDEKSFSEVYKRLWFYSNGH
jgi:hypothetical protein